MANKILLGVPIASGLEAQTSSAIVRMVQHRADVGYFWAEGSPVDLVRSKLVRKFLTSTDATHLMMMDSDIIPPDNILELLLDCKWPMAAAIVPILTDGVIHTNIHIAKPNGQSGANYLIDWDADGLPFEVVNAGTGCVLYERKVFEDIAWPWFRFHEKNSDGDAMGEDIYFGQRAANHGYSYKVHPKALCGHIKKLNLLDMVNAMNKLAKGE